MFVGVSLPPFHQLWVPTALRYGDYSLTGWAQYLLQFFRILTLLTLVLI
jgi:hypothetical protein